MIGVGSEHFFNAGWLRACRLGANQSDPAPHLQMQLGDSIHAALAVVGITPDRVERFFGVDCGCHERQEQLNQLGRWAARVIGGKVHRAKEYLEEILK